MLSHDEPNVLHVPARLLKLHVEERADLLNICGRLLPERLLNLVVNELALVRAVHLLFVRVLQLLDTVYDFLKRSDVHVLRLPLCHILVDL